VIVENFEEMEQKIVVYALSEMKYLQRNMEYQAREGWFVHEVVKQGGDSITSSMSCLVVYRKD